MAPSPGAALCQLLCFHNLRGLFHQSRKKKKSNDKSKVTHFLVGDTFFKNMKMNISIQQIYSINTNQKQFFVKTDSI